MAIIRYPFRLLGLALIAIALVLLADDLANMDWGTFSGFAPGPLGALLHENAPSLLPTAQNFIQRFVWPYLWDPIIQTALNWWDWAAIGGMGLILATLARRPRVKIDPAAVETAG